MTIQNRVLSLLVVLVMLTGLVAYVGVKSLSDALNRQIETRDGDLRRGRTSHRRDSYRNGFGRR